MKVKRKLKLSKKRKIIKPQKIGFGNKKEPQKHVIGSEEVVYKEVILGGSSKEKEKNLCQLKDLKYRVTYSSSKEVIINHIPAKHGYSIGVLVKKGSKKEELLLMTKRGQLRVFKSIDRCL